MRRPDRWHPPPRGHDDEGYFDLALRPLGIGKIFPAALDCRTLDAYRQRSLARRSRSQSHSAHRRRIGLVATDPALFPHLTAEENIRFGISPKDSESKFETLLRLFELRSLQQARIPTLSGGERKRVAIARALAGEPLLLLLDEVFTGMHRAQRNELILRVREHCGQRGIGILSVTHDPAEAVLLNTETLTIDDGKITAQGPTRNVLSDDLLPI